MPVTRKNLANGQVAASATAIYTCAAQDAERVSVLFRNVGGLSETLVVTVLPQGGTSRQVFRVVLAANEGCLIDGLIVEKDDILKAATSNATSVDYLVSLSDAKGLTFQAFDANGALKQVNSGISGNQSITGDLTVSGGDIDAGASGTAGTVDIFPSTASKGKNQFTAADNAGDTTNTITNRSQAGARTFTIGDPGASADFDMIVGGKASGVGAATSKNQLLIKKTAIADNTATDLITVTVPNGEHAAAIRLVFLASLGTGTDTFESSRCAEGMVVLARKTGVNVVGAAATLTLEQIATTSGGGTLTLAYDLGSVSGAVGATNTFTIRATLVATGTITDLQCVVLAELINAEASGVTIAAA
jgi:hypothetical protein